LPIFLQVCYKLMRVTFSVDVLLKEFEHDEGGSKSG